MTQAGTVARRELRSYFDHPTAYILVIAFLTLALFLTFRSISANRIATMRPFFDMLPWLLALFVPAITMRSLAEERRSRTLEWLIAQPLQESDVVAGKFAGNWVLIFAAIAGSIPAAIGILLVSSSDAGMMFAQYFGAALLAAQAVSVGLWASSLTKNQITAFILAASVSIVLVLLGMPVVYNALPVRVAGIVAGFSVLPHFENVARGAIDVRDVLYFVTTTGLFLALAGVALSRERLSRSRGAFRRLRIAALLMFASVVVLNLLGSFVNVRFDLTSERLFTLSPGSRDVLRGLDDIVQVKLFVSTDLPPNVQLSLRDVRDLLSDMKGAAGGKLEVIERNPARDAEAREDAMSLGISETRFNVLQRDQQIIKAGWFGLAVVYASDNRVIPIVDRTEDLEFRIATFIASLTNPVKTKVGFATGYGMRVPPDFPEFMNTMRDRYAITPIGLEDSLLPSISPDTVGVIFVAAPNRQVRASSIARLREYVDAGGSMFIMYENMRPDPNLPDQAARVVSGIADIFIPYGLSVQAGLVFDMKSHAVVQDQLNGTPINRNIPLWPILGSAGAHPAARGISNLVVAWAASLVLLDSARVKPLFITTDAAGLRPETADPTTFEITPAPTDTLRTRIIAAAIETRPAAAADSSALAARAKGRIIVIGDSDFLDSDFVENNPNNLVFASNALDWLAGEAVLLRIPSKQRLPPTLVFANNTQRVLFKWGNLVGVPALFALAGAVTILGRRRRAEKRWNDAAPAGARRDSGAARKSDA